MKIKLIVLAIRHHQVLLPGLVIASSLLMSPLSFGSIYNSTVDLDRTTIVDGDSIDTHDSIALSSTTANGSTLDLSGGSMRIEIDALLSDQLLYGLNLNNQRDNNLGNGSAILITQNNINSARDYLARGIFLGDGTNLSASALNLVINSTTDAIGIHSNSNYDGNNTIDLGVGSVISITNETSAPDVGKSAAGILLGANGQLTANQLELNIKGQNNVAGIDSLGGSVDLGQGSKITLVSLDNSKSSKAISIDGNGVFTANALQINGQNAGGILAKETSTINLGSGSRIQVSGVANTGISTNGTDVNINADRLTINTNGAIGLDLNNGSHNTNLGSHSTITTTGDSALGIWLIGSQDSLLVADALTIHTTGANAKALEVRRGNAVIGDGSILIAENSGALVVSGLRAPATATVNNSQLISGGNYAASAQQSDSLLNLNNVEATVDNHGNRANALWAYADGVININSVKVNGTSGVYGMVANVGGKINLSGQIVINSVDIAMLADGATSYIQGSGQMTINGSISAKNSGLVDLTVTSGSVLNGNIYQSDNGIADLTIDNSLWQFNDDSSVNNLTLANNSRVVFNSINNNADGSLTINNLSGNGLFTMRVNNIVNGTGDRLYITGSSGGNHGLSVINNGNLATDGTETLTMITTADGLANFAMTNQVELGGYLYDLRQVAGKSNHWELYSSGKIPDAASASANMFNTSYLMNYAETQTLLQRMGDLHQGSATGNVWVRTFYGNFNSFDSGKLSGFDMSYRGLQLGADKALVQANGTFYSGVFGSLSDSNQRYERGDGSVKSQSVGIYGSYMLNSGTYLDAVLKYQHHRTKLNVVDTQGNGINGHGSANGLALVVEGGHRFHLNADQSGWYVEPQLQLSYAHQGDSHIDNSNGLSVDLDSYHSLLGRVGTIIGYQVNSATATPVNIYVKNSWQHEFNGDTRYWLNGNEEDFSFKGGAWISGIGISVQLERQHTLFMDMEKTIGDQFKQNQMNAGYRYSF